MRSGPARQRDPNRRNRIIRYAARSWPPLQSRAATRRCATAPHASCLVRRCSGHLTLGRQLAGLRHERPREPARRDDRICVSDARYCTRASPRIRSRGGVEDSDAGGSFAAQGVVRRAHLRPLPPAQSSHAGREPLPGAQTRFEIRHGHPPACPACVPFCAAGSPLGRLARLSAFTQPRDYAEPSEQLAVRGQRWRQRLGIT
jgi:hypothetical protein